MLFYSINFCIFSACSSSVFPNFPEIPACMASGIQLLFLYVLECEIRILAVD